MDREREAVFRGNERDGRREEESERNIERRRREREGRSVYSLNTRAGEGGQQRSAKGMKREKRRRIASAGV